MNLSIRNVVLSIKFYTVTTIWLKINLKREFKINENICLFFHSGNEKKDEKKATCEGKRKDKKVASHRSEWINPKKAHVDKVVLPQFTLLRILKRSNGREIKTHRDCDWDKKKRSIPLTSSMSLFINPSIWLKLLTNSLWFFVQRLFFMRMWCVPTVIVRSSLRAQGKCLVSILFTQNQFLRLSLFPR